MMGIGAKLWERTYKAGMNDDDAALIAGVRAGEMIETMKPEMRDWLGRITMGDRPADPDGPEFKAYANGVAGTLRSHLWWCAKWAHYAFPSVITSHRRRSDDERAIIEGMFEGTSHCATHVKTRSSTPEEDAFLALRLVAGRVRSGEYADDVESWFFGVLEGKTLLDAIKSGSFDEWAPRAAKRLVEGHHPGVRFEGNGRILLGRALPGEPLVARYSSPIVQLCLKRVEALIAASGTRSVEDGTMFFRPNARYSDHTFDIAGWLGLAAWEMLGRKNASDPVVYSVLMWLADRMKEKDVLLGEFAFAFLGHRTNDGIPDRNKIDLVTGGFHWARSGFPVIRVEPKSAAMHVFTHVSSEVAKSIRWPFDAFAIEAPGEFLGSPGARMLFAKTNTLTNEALFHVNVMAGGFLLGQSRDSIGRLMTAADDDIEPVMWEDSKFKLEEGDESALARATRIMAGVCTRIVDGLDDGVTFKEKKGTGIGAPVSKLLPKVPSRVFLFAEDVQLDLREMAAASAGEKRSVEWKSRWIVRGHYREQPCGPGRTVIKKTWVRPYWKNQGEAPMRVRGYVGV